MGKVFLLLFTLNILIGCNDYSPILENRNTRDTISLFNSNIGQQSVKLSDFVDSINYYPIPTDDDYLIGQVSNLIVTDSFFIVADKKITHSVFILPKNNTLKSFIHQHGNGPTEYLRLSDVFFDDTLNEIGIYCNLKKEILYYHLNGEFSHKCKIPYYGEYVHPIGKGYLLNTGYKENDILKYQKTNIYPNLIYFDKESDSISLICDNYFKGPVNHSIVWSSNSVFSIWDDTVAIKPDHSNIVYHCTPEGMFPAHFLDSGEGNIDERFWDKSNEKNMNLNKLEEYCRSENLCEIIRYLESLDFINFTCRQKGVLVHYIYSKSSKKIFAFKEIENDMDSFATFYPKTLKGNKFYGTIPSSSIALQKELTPNKNIPISLLNTKENDNPIIIELTLKKF